MRVKRIVLGVFVLTLVMGSAVSVSGQSESRGALLVQLDGSSRAFTDFILGRLTTVTVKLSIPELKVSGAVATLSPWSRRDLPIGAYTLQVRMGDVRLNRHLTLRPDSLTVVVVDTKTSSMTEERFDLASLVLLRTETPAMPTNPLCGFPALYDKPPSVLMYARPDYPRPARNAEVEGIVVVRAQVNQDGVVVDANVVQSVPMLNEAALAAVRSWRFAPAELLGQAVSADVFVPVRFTLTGR